MSEENTRKTNGQKESLLSTFRPLVKNTNLGPFSLVARNLNLVRTIQRQYQLLADPKPRLGLVQPYLYPRAWPSISFSRAEYHGYQPDMVWVGAPPVQPFPEAEDSGPVAQVIRRPSIARVSAATPAANSSPSLPKPNTQIRPIRQTPTLSVQPTMEPKQPTKKESTGQVNRDDDLWNRMFPPRPSFLDGVRSRETAKKTALEKQTPPPSIPSKLPRTRTWEVKPGLSNQPVSLQKKETAGVSETHIPEMPDGSSKPSYTPSQKSDDEEKDGSDTASIQTSFVDDDSDNVLKSEIKPDPLSASRAPQSPMTPISRKDEHLAVASNDIGKQPPSKSESLNNPVEEQKEATSIAIDSTPFKPPIVQTLEEPTIRPGPKTSADPSTGEQTTLEDWGGEQIKGITKSVESAATIHPTRDIDSIKKKPAIKTGGQDNVHLDSAQPLKEQPGHIKQKSPTESIQRVQAAQIKSPAEPKQALTLAAKNLESKKLDKEKDSVQKIKNDPGSEVRSEKVSLPVSSETPSPSLSLDESISKPAIDLPKDLPAKGAEIKHEPALSNPEMPDIPPVIENSAAPATITTGLQSEKIEQEDLQEIAEPIAPILPGEAAGIKPTLQAKSTDKASSESRSNKAGPIARVQVFPTPERSQTATQPEAAPQKSRISLPVVQSQIEPEDTIPVIKAQEPSKIKSVLARLKETTGDNIHKPALTLPSQKAAQKIMPVKLESGESESPTPVPTMKRTEITSSTSPHQIARSKKSESLSRIPLTRSKTPPTQTLAAENVTTMPIIQTISPQRERDPEIPQISLQRVTKPEIQLYEIDNDDTRAAPEMVKPETEHVSSIVAGERTVIQARTAVPAEPIDRAEMMDVSKSVGKKEKPRIKVEQSQETTRPVMQPASRVRVQASHTPPSVQAQVSESSLPIEPTVESKNFVEPKSLETEVQASLDFKPQIEQPKITPTKLYAEKTRITDSHPDLPEPKPMTERSAVRIQAKTDIPETKRSEKSGRSTIQVTTPSSAGLHTEGVIAHGKPVQRVSPLTVQNKSELVAGHSLSTINRYGIESATRKRIPSTSFIEPESKLSQLADRPVIMEQPLPFISQTIPLQSTMPGSSQRESRTPKIDLNEASKTRRGQTLLPVQRQISTHSPLPLYTTAIIQRTVEEPSNGEESPTTESSTENETQDNKVDMDQIAQNVYEAIKQRLVIEHERYWGY